jgi:uncharacterized FlgJ-related protein
MIYKFNESELQFVRVKWPQRIIALAVIVAAISTIVSFSVSLDKKLIERQVIVIMEKQNRFDSTKLISEIKKMNFAFPYIVYGQAVLETNNFRSRIFLENKNLFGMRVATQRVNVCKGSQYDHACYNSWIDSVIDYGLYYATYLSRLTTESDYYDYLSQFYAEDKNYISKLKEIIETKNLKLLFQ